MNNDLISRQAILKRIEKIRYGVQMMDDTHRASIIMNGMYLCEEAVRNLPSAERKRGNWLPMFNGEFTGGAYWFKCSECGRVVPDVRNGGWNFCPSCGVREE